MKHAGFRQKQRKANMQLVTSMLIFGTIGIFVRYLPFSSAFTALARGGIGTVFLWLAAGVAGRRTDWSAIKSNLLLLILSGGAIGFNWILLFEAYRYTTVSAATLCYYMAPVIVILLSPVLLKERLTKKKLLCVVLSLFGMVLISGMITGGGLGRDARGILFGLGAAVFYAAVILINKFLRGISGLDATMMQLLAGTVILLPYVLVTEGIPDTAVNAGEILLLVLVGVLHTGIGYLLYFSSMETADAQTVAVFGYLDPAVAILLSALVLGEQMDFWSGLGTLLILGASAASEIKIEKRKRA